MTFNGVSAGACLVGLLLVLPGAWGVLGEDEAIPSPPAGLVLERNLAYREGHPRWVLDVIYTETPPEHAVPAVLLVHGGGWSYGDQTRFTKLGYQLALEGYVVVLPTYRMYQDAPFPACLEDVKNAIRWTRAHADRYDIDPDAIGAYGNSAGATLALTAALTADRADMEGDGTHLDQSSALQAVVCSGAVGDMTHQDHSDLAKGVYRKLVDGPDTRKSTEALLEPLRAASPATYLRKEAPPMLILHGARDEVVHIASTDEFVDKATRIGAPVEYIRHEAAGHAVMGYQGKGNHAAILKFFATHLR